jgi:hypothetical protein
LRIAPPQAGQTHDGACTTSVRGRCSGSGRRPRRRFTCSSGRRFVWAFARRLVFFQFFQRQLELADHAAELLRGPAEALPAQAGDVQLQRLDFEGLGDQTGARRRALGRLDGDQRPQRLGIIGKDGTLDRHTSFIAHREGTRY